jgi:uncharacterized membrane protein YccC
MSAHIRLQESFKFALSMVLMYWLALSMDWDLASYGALAIALVSLSTSGASITKGVMRVIGTTIGAVIGVILVAWLSQERWGMMFALAGYLIFAGYFIQTSRYPYAWFVAGYVPLTVWADTYGAVDNSFHFAVFRWLETTAGVLIFSVVSVVLWPKSSGGQFFRLGGEYLDQLCRLLRLNQYAQREEKRDDIAAIQGKLDVLLAQLQKTLSAAVIDTMVVREQKHEWQHALTILRELTDSLALWQATDEAYLQRTSKQNLVDLEQALARIEMRSNRIGELWRAGQVPGEVSQGDDQKLLQPIPLDLSSATTMTSVEQGILMNRNHQLRQLDQQSQKLLLLLRILNGLDATAALTEPLDHLPSDQPPYWDSVRFMKALASALAFISGFLFWILPSDPPPGGPMIPEMCGIFGLLVALGADVRYLGLTLATVGLIVIAPIYFVVMPWLDDGIGLLTMIFILSFVSGYLGERWPMIKTSIMVLFVMTTSISNDQSYSFHGLDSQRIYDDCSGAYHQPGGDVNVVNTS